MYELNSLDRETVATIISMLLLFLMASIVVGAYAFYAWRSKRANDEVCKREAMEVWKQKKDGLTAKIKEGTKQEIKNQQEEMLAEVEELDETVHELENRIKHTYE